MDAGGFQLEHAVDVEVSCAFAWHWRTDVRNWDDPPAQFELEGPFAEGTWGTTRMPGEEPRRWQVRDVRPGRSFVLTMPLEGATLTFEWRFDVVSDQRTRVTQRIALAGRGAGAYAAQVEAAFAANLASGMQRIAAAMESAGASATNSHGSNHTPGVP